ncbi:aldehyde dehydrogenase family protein, partial [Sinorhizobium medicae]|nr:aldehyde dehydrogenase family protein [Sinorhizobium medicae]
MILSRVVHGSFSGRGVGNRQLNNRSVTLMPFKHNAARRHRIGSMKFKVTNWPSRSGILERHAILKKTADEILARKDELGRLLSREEGKTLAEGIGETVRAGQIFEFFAGETLRLAGEVVPSVRPGIGVEI